MNGPWMGLNKLSDSGAVIQGGISRVCMIRWQAKNGDKELRYYWTILDNIGIIIENVRRDRHENHKKNQSIRMQFYLSDFRRLKVMSFKEMPEYFALE